MKSTAGRRQLNCVIAIQIFDKDAFLIANVRGFDNSLISRQQSIRAKLICLPILLHRRRKYTGLQIINPVMRHHFS